MYDPPINIGGMLSFSSEGAYNSFINATYLLEDYWEYSNVDYEGTPAEIDNLGEEPLNALDCALDFNSLRYKNEVREFYNHEWEDTANIVVDDDDYEIVLNEENEVKIGAKFYKFLSTSNVAVISNSNDSALNLVRIHGIFANHSDISIYNEDLGSFINPPKVIILAKPQGCNNYDLYAYAANLTPLSSTANQWNVELDFSCYNNTVTYDIIPPSVLGNYTINWGDGTIETFQDRYTRPAKRRHIYSEFIAPGNSTQKHIIVTCVMVNPTSEILWNCPGIVNITLTEEDYVTLSSPIVSDCISPLTIRKKINGLEQIVGDKKYRLEYKQKLKARPILGFPHIKTSATFNKYTGIKWKKTKPLNKFSVTLSGNVYDEFTCSNITDILNESKSTSKKKKLKIKTPDTELPNNFRIRKSLPYAISSNYFWTYNNNQNFVGNYNVIFEQ